MTSAEWEAANEDDSDRWARYPAQTGLTAPNGDRVVWRDRGARIAALEAENARLREGIRVLADGWDEHNEGSDYWRVFGPQVVSIPFAVRSLRALLATSPAATTGEAACDLEVRGRLDGIAEWCATHRRWLTDHGCPAGPTSSGETGADEPVISDCERLGYHVCGSAAVVTPGDAEDGA